MRGTRIDGQGLKALPSTRLGGTSTAARIVFPFLTGSSSRACGSLATAFSWNLLGQVRNPRDTKDLIKTALRSRAGKDLLMLVIGVAAAVERRSLLNVPNEGICLFFCWSRLTFKQRMGPSIPPTSKLTDIN